MDYEFTLIHVIIFNMQGSERCLIHYLVSSKYLYEVLKSS